MISIHSLNLVDTNSDSRAPYEYAPLAAERYTRLIHLQPGKWRDPLNCYITTCTLDTVPPYSALSYTWGSSGRSRTIRCDDRTLSITANLWKALYHLRRETETRVFWIDAVCINQADISERNSQVRLMKEIYQTAQEVVVWIGEENNNTADGIKVLSQFSVIASEGKHPDFTDRYFLGEVLKETGLPDSDSPLWKAVIDLYRRTWFTRIWVIQELSVATSAIVYCGQQQFPWSYFSYAAPCVDRVIRWNYYGRKLGFEYNRFISMDFSRARFQQGIDVPLLWSLSLARSSFSMDPRDKVFGLLGLAADAKDSLPNPDYSKPVAQVYETVTKNMIINQGSLEILGEVQDPRWTLVKKLPSWTVDWSAQSRATPFRSRLVWTDFLAAGDSQVRVGTSSIPGTLVLTGINVDTVGQCGLPLLRSRPITVHLLESLNRHSLTSQISMNLNSIAQALWEQWESIALKLGSYPNRRSVSEAYHRNLTAGAHLPDSPHDLDFLYKAYLQTSDFLCGPVMFACSGEPSLETCRHWRPYATAVENACHGRCFFTTEKGYMGLAPPSTRSGDLICVLLGGKTPYVLRRDGKGFHRFIGECYIEGLMNGEAMNRLDSGESGLEEFVLR